MNIAETFIRRPIMTTLVMLTILLFGIVGYRALPVSDLPNVDYPTINVSASLAGASPDTMASAVATVLEKEFSTIAGIDSMSSSSSQGSTSVTLQFTLNRKIEDAAADVQSAIARAQKNLPSNMSTPPSYKKVNPADQPILYVALTSPTLPMSDLDEFGETLMAQQISMIDGVAQVQVYGSQKYAVRIELDPNELSSRGLSLGEVSAAVQDQNVNVPLGTLLGPHQAFTIQSNGQLYAAKEYSPLIVAFRNGLPVRLRDLGNVQDSVENNQVAAWFCMSNTPGRVGSVDRSIVLAIQRQPGTNTVEVANAIKNLLPTFEQQLPAAVKLNILIDRSIWIEESVKDVKFTLLLTLGLVVLVIFLFLRNFSATVIPSLTLPMSIVGTFMVMCLLDYSLDNLSLMALTLSVGFVVDDAIVMLENIVRHMEMGKTRMQAALDGSNEVGFTIISMTISLAAVFIPVLFLPGLMGRLFREFSVTIGVAVVVSGFIALSLTPMLGSRFLKEPHKIHHGWAYRATEAALNGLTRFYGWSLLGVLNHRRMTLLVSLAMFGGMVYMAMIIPTGFIPSEDREQVVIRTEAAQDVSFNSMVEHQMALGEILQNDPNVDRFMSSVGARSGGGVNVGRLMVMLKTRKDRPLSADEMIVALRPKLAAVTGIKTYPQNPPTINVGGRESKSLYQLTLQGPDTAQLYKYAGELEEQIRGRADFLDVNSDMQLKSPQLNVNVDRDKAAALGVTPAQVEDTLYNAYGARQITTIFAPNNQYQVILELKPEYQLDPTVLSMLYVRSSNGNMVPVKAVADLVENLGPLQINHTGQLPSVTVSFNLRPGISLGQAIDQINAMTAGTMPGGITTSFQGTANEFQKAMRSLMVLLVLALVVIYVVLGILYESFIHPLTILSALPFAGFGALLTLLIFHAELSIYAFVGIIMLVGLVKKNGIMMVDFAIEAQRQGGKSPMEAIHEACIIRFRPITMTTMAALMGGLPIALGFGAGAEARRPLGLAVVGGLLFSQTLTLYVTPVFYVYMEKLRHWMIGTALPTSRAAEPILDALAGEDAAPAVGHSPISKV